MNYKLTIIKYEKNENYEAELAKYKEDTRYGYGGMNPRIDDNMPQPRQSSRSLEVVLTDEEYESVKKAVLSTFK